MKDRAEKQDRTRQQAQWQASQSPHDGQNCDRQQNAHTHSNATYRAKRKSKVQDTVCGVHRGNCSSAWSAKKRPNPEKMANTIALAGFLAGIRLIAFVVRCGNGDLWIRCDDCYGLNRVATATRACTTLSSPSPVIASSYCTAESDDS